MPLDGDYEPSNAGWAQKQTDQILATGTTDGLTVANRPIVLITYRGKKSGAVRKIPLMRVEHEGSYAVVASKGGAPEHPTWYSSIVAEPHIELQDGSVTKDYDAREVSGDERATWWDIAVAAYPPYAEYQTKTDREIPLFVASPRD